MAIFNVSFFSNTMGKECEMIVIKPDELQINIPVVYQLHGYSDNHHAWLRRTNIELYAKQYGVMIVLPDGGKGYYSDAKSGNFNYESHILEVVDFIDDTFNTNKDRKSRGIGGLSMGGYGAMKLALKHPEMFSSVAAHSGVLDIKKFFNENPKHVLHDIFGEDVPDDENLFHLAESLQTDLSIYIDCGEQDFLIEHNRNFKNHLESINVKCSYAEYPGTHNWQYWEEHITKALRFHKKHLRCLD